MSIGKSLERIPLVVLFVIGVQLHFLAVIFPETRIYSIHIFGIGLSVISAAMILLSYVMKRRLEESTTKMEY